MPFKDLLTPLTSSRTLTRVALLAMGMGAYAAIPVFKEYSAYQNYGDSPSQIHAALSMCLGCLLVFRINAAYARWWEARTLWGCLINCSRNLALKVSVLAAPAPGEAADFARLQIAFPRALTDYLRKLPYENREIFPHGAPQHPPLAIANQLYDWIRAWLSDGRLDGDELRVIDTEWSKLMDVCGACERIANTPFVVSYRTFLRQCIALFLFTLPWGIAEDFKWWTIPLTMVTAYFMIGMETVAEHVEEPFGFDEDDLDLQGMSDAIERSVRDIFSRPQPAQLA